MHFPKPKPPTSAAPPAAERAVPESEALNETRDIEAATWAARRHEGLDAEAEAQLQDWLRADAANAAALADMARTRSQVCSMPLSDVARLRAGLRAGTRDNGPHQEIPAVRRSIRAAPAALAALVLTVACAGWLGWRQLPTFEQGYATARGQQLVATLRDDAAQGSTLHLDTATRVETRLFRDRREVRLHEGQVMFSVHGDAQRPFDVWAGRLRITVVGTRFSVRHTASGVEAGQTVVTVEEGKVRVAVAGEDAAAVTPATELRAGETLSSGSDGRLSPVTTVPLASVAAWRSGRISFDHTPLAQALAEFERYGPTGLVVNDPAVAELPVGGSYSLRQLQRFADALPQLLPVRLVQRGSVTEIVAR